MAASRCTRLVGWCLAALLAGCAVTPGVPGSSDIDVGELTSGVAIFGVPVEPAPRPGNGILAVDDDMAAFVAAEVGHGRAAASRLRNLIQGMLDSGLMDLAYDPNATLTAAATFHARRGNCLAFTNLFVALGREAGLDVSFQRVEIPPMWFEDAGFVILNDHINAKVSNVRMDLVFHRDYVVDFNQAEFKANYEQYAVPDSYAFALYHNNLAVDAMKANDYRTAFAHLARSITLDPRIAGSWVNLGVLYSRNERYAHAEASYLRALALETGNKVALTNLAHLNEYLGNTELAERYYGRVKYYQRRNPYYHYALAEQALNDGLFDEALRLIDRAIRIRKEEHLFHFLKGVALLRLGHADDARKSIQRARDCALYETVQHKYDAKLRLLDPHRSVDAPHLERAAAG